MRNGRYIVRVLLLAAILVASLNSGALKAEGVAPVQHDISQALSVLGRIIFHFVLLILPGLAVTLIAVERGVTNEICLGILGLTAALLAGYMYFWIWFLAPVAGKPAGVVFPVLWLSIILSKHRIFGEQASGLKRLAAPVALIFASSVLIAATGFLFDGVSSPLLTAKTRFSHRLPIDNEIPYLVASGLLNHKIPIPLLGDWLSSDRPPLQSGLVIGQEPFWINPRELDYEIISVIAQSLWIFALWLLLKALEFPSRLVALCLGVCLFSGFVFINTFFVWPKLLAAACTVAVAAILLGRGHGVAGFSAELRAVLAGALSSLALLAHGGSIFGLIGIGATLILLRQRASWRKVGLFASMAVLVYLPWMLYQKFYDPPGDFLLKKHLAGIDSPDKNSFFEDLLNAYEKLPASAILEHKWHNLDRVIRVRAYCRELGSFLEHSMLPGDANRTKAAAAARDIRGDKFFGFAAQSGILLMGLPALAVSTRKIRQTILWRSSRELWLCVAFTILNWCVLLFGPGTTALHQGTYMLVLFAYSAGLAGLWSLHPWVAIVAGALHLVGEILFYTVYMAVPVSGGVPSENKPLRAFLVLAVVSTLGVVLLLRKISRTEAVQIRETAL